MAYRLIEKPNPGEYPAYAEMYLKYFADDGRILERMGKEAASTRALAESLSESQLLYRYAPGKWSIKEVLVHIVDDERIFAYRALRFARGEQQNLIGFDQDAYAALSGADARPLQSILAEYDAVRCATIALFDGLPEDALVRMGHGTGSFNNATVRALAYHIAGHEVHHMQLIRERYLEQR